MGIQCSCLKDEQESQEIVQVGQERAAAIGGQVLCEEEPGEGSAKSRFVFVDDECRDPDSEDGDGENEESEKDEGKKQLLRQKTALLMNRSGSGTGTSSMGVVKSLYGEMDCPTLDQLASQTVLNCSTDGGEQGRHLTDEQVDSLVVELGRAVDWQYDTMLAELILEKVKEHLPAAEQRKVLCTAVVKRLDRKLRYLSVVGQACCSSGTGWFNFYKDGPQSIDGCIDKQDSTILHYKARVTIPAGLQAVMGVANEVELLPTWNKLVIGTPEVVGRRTAHYMCLHYQMSFLGGMYKVDILNEVRRFSETRGGMLVEYIRSVDRNHPCYKEPESGFKRPQTELKNVWLACGENSSVLIQIGKLKLPFSASRWLASSIGGVAGRFIVGGLLNNSLQAAQPGNPWEKLLEEDKLGLYARLREIMDSEGSASRQPESEGAAPNFQDSDLAVHFRRKRYSRLQDDDGDDKQGSRLSMNSRVSAASCKSGEELDIQNSVNDMTAFATRATERRPSEQAVLDAAEAAKN